MTDVAQSLAHQQRDLAQISLHGFRFALRLFRLIRTVEMLADGADQIAAGISH